MLKMQKNYWKQGTKSTYIQKYHDISTYSFYIFFKCKYSFYAGVEKKGNQGEVYYWWIWRKVF